MYIQPCSPGSSYYWNQHNLVHLHLDGDFDLKSCAKEKKVVHWFPLITSKKDAKETVRYKQDPVYAEQILIKLKKSSQAAQIISVDPHLLYLDLKNQKKNKTYGDR